MGSNIFAAAVHMFWEFSTYLCSVSMSMSMSFLIHIVPYCIHVNSGEIKNCCRRTMNLKLLGTVIVQGECFVGMHLASSRHV